MNKFIDILEEIEQTNRALKVAEAHEDELIKNYVNYPSPKGKGLVKAKID